MRKKIYVVESLGQVHRPKRVSQCTYDPRNTHFLVPQGQRPAGLFCSTFRVMANKKSAEILEVSEKDVSLQKI